MHRLTLPMLLGAALTWPLACSDGDEPLPNTATSTTTTTTGTGGSSGTGGPNVAARWRVIDSGTERRLNAVWALAEDDVWAVGDKEILHYDGMEWLRPEADMLPNNTFNANWNAITATGPTDLWLAGIQPDENGPVLLHFDGTTWSSVIARDDAAGGETYGFFDITSTASGVWIADAAVDGTDSGHGYFFDTAIDDRLEARTRSVGVSGTHVFFGTLDGEIEHFDGTAWSTVADVPSTGLSDTLLAVHALSDNDIWLVGPQKRVHFDGTSWNITTDHSAANDLWGASSDDVWLVGESIDHYDGTSWRAGTPPEDVVYRGIHGTAADDIWAVGDAGAIAHFGG